ncbi:unnamed protein product, partial [Bubo scandiacus]
ILIEWLRQDATESLTPSSNYHGRGVNERDLVCLLPVCVRACKECFLAYFLAESR